MLKVTGTLVWYYYICHREVWLISRKITADQDDPNIDYGRFLQENVYERDKKEITVGHLKVDLIKKRDGGLVVGEIKKSSASQESARMQLLFYLYELKQLGIKAEGELLFPKERKKSSVILDDTAEQEIEALKEHILQIISLDIPPQPKWINWCRNCAYKELCWS